ncbi:spore-wall fungal hydrophobin dewA [Aspergillus sclerotioniger CBS 115572]|uniref:Hydrophobin n=1 Tax=Aspergillus sclerotioniger CBS 115572 TaxID=1450535 RepID=A0A317X4J1_9EURO|nr:spore-wall fungal hydrophobin dewA [Aspergillus sclerotioniger CBS 115572]PWY93111.1 spore-wall fungal hydrophobin dewA [Aspergillus sclerotioniger CBS 115572]
MKFTIAAIVGFAMTAAAVPAVARTQQKLSIDDAKGQCSTGDIYCCNPTNTEKTDGILNNLAGKSLVLKTLIDGENTSCASTSLIKDLDLLYDDKSSYCKNTIACCPNGNCAALDLSDN